MAVSDHPTRDRVIVLWARWGMPAGAPSANNDRDVSLRDATKVWATVGVNSFGGPAGQIAVMHREVVEERHWISERRFLHALNYCFLLPGPEAQQLATYVGWLMHGVRGGVIAGALFVLPGFVVMMALSVIYALYGQVGWVAGLLFGLQAAVIAIVAQAVVRVAQRTLHTPVARGVAVAAFVALFAFGVPFPLVILAAGLFGWLAGRRRPDWFPGGSHPDDDGTDTPADARATVLADDEVVSPASGRRALIAAFACLVLWLAPVVVLLLALGSDHVFTQEAILFSKTAVITFGGAYAVLAYISQQAVQTYGWISPSDMTTGLALAETTPGPLIMVVQFVGFLAAFNNPGDLPPVVAGLIGATITVWVTFVPCFMFIFAGAPYVERLRHNRALHHALSAIGAAIVGVIANLAVWFAITTLFPVNATVEWGPVRLTIPELTSIDWWSLALMVLAGVLIFRLRWSTLRVLAACGAVGVVLALVGLV